MPSMLAVGVTQGDVTQGAQQRRALWQHLHKQQDDWQIHSIGPLLKDAAARQCVEQEVSCCLAFQKRSMPRVLKVPILQGHVIPNIRGEKSALSRAPKVQHHCAGLTLGKRSMPSMLLVQAF